MATSKELLKAIENGAEIRVGTTGKLVEYSPRYKGDRLAWTYKENTTVYRYAAKECVAVPMIDRDAQAEDLAKASAEENTAAEVPEYKVIGQDDMRSVVARLKAPLPVLKAKVKPEVSPEVIEALRMLRLNGRYDNELRPYIDTLDNAGIFAAVDEATRYNTEPVKAPARAFPPETAPCAHCRGDYTPKRDGTLRKHTCWSYDYELKTIVYGPLDIHGRQNT